MLGCSPDPFHRPRKASFVLHRMFPNSNDLPSPTAQQARHLLISLSVASNFRLPIAGIGRRHPAMPLAAVPVAAIHKHSHLRPSEYDVRSAFYIPRVGLKSG
jgi:hypothetical protein